MGANRYRNEYGNNVNVIGASSKRERFSNRAVRALVEAGYTVIPIHPTEVEIEGLEGSGIVVLQECTLVNGLGRSSSEF